MFTLSFFWYMAFALVLGESVKKCVSVIARYLICDGIPTKEITCVCTDSACVRYLRRKSLPVIIKVALGYSLCHRCLLCVWISISLRISRVEIVKMPFILRNRNLLVDVLAILFGISGWMGITAVYLELPLIVDKAPEGWKLPSYIAILVQVGNVANVVYILFEKYSPVKVKDCYWIYAMMISGCVASIGLAFLYQKRENIGGQEHSVWLLVFAGILAAVGCLSSVLSMPYMGRFKETYLVSFFFGQSLNGFISSIASLIQGSSAQRNCLAANSTETIPKESTISGPTFEPKMFFLFVFVMMVLSTVAVIMLHNLRQCRREHAPGYSLGFEKRGSVDMYEVIPAEQRLLSRFTYVFLMLLIGTISFVGYGVFPGLQSYSCRPYGANAYHLSVTLSAFANPVACITAMCCSQISLRNLFAQSAVVAIITSYLMYTAIHSPSPPFVGTLFGTILVVSTNTSLP